MSLFGTEEILLLTQGTVEYILVDITDASNEVLTVTGTSPRFDVYSEAGVNKYTNQAALDDPDVLKPMRIRCLIDTTSGGLWAAGNYYLYPKLDTYPEVPRLGPYLFVVVA